ncbi:MAG: hypothetical protein LIR50_19245 [Bacillota bacterium]|nr:hypothetical protein [Bacillota bacterium]
MKKIKKYLEEHGYKIEFVGTYSRKQYRSNHSCLEDKYNIIKNDNIFELIVKLTGKKLYMMNEENQGKYKLIAGGESQDYFINMLENYNKNNK